VIHSDDCQLVTGSFIDYQLSTAATMPSFEIDSQVQLWTGRDTLSTQPAPDVSAGAASAAVVNAAIDALRLLGGGFFSRMPLTPENVWDEIQRSRPKKRGRGEM
jgi:hypothetical protein